MMTSAEMDYFDPRDPEPACDICGEPQQCCEDWSCGGNEWNGETGNHVTCEERQVAEENDEPPHAIGTCPSCGSPADFHAVSCPELRL